MTIQHEIWGYLKSVKIQEPPKIASRNIRVLRFEHTPLSCEKQENTLTFMWADLNELRTIRDTIDKYLRSL